MQFKFDSLAYSYPSRRNVVYGKKEEYPVLLTEEQIIGLAEGLQDIRMGRIVSDEEAEADLDRFFERREWENEKD